MVWNIYGTGFQVFLYLFLYWANVDINPLIFFVALYQKFMSDAMDIFKINYREWTEATYEFIFNLASAVIRINYDFLLI